MNKKELKLKRTFAPNTIGFSGLAEEERIDLEKDRSRIYEEVKQKAKEETKEEIDKSKIRTIEALGIFAAIIAFILVDVKIIGSLPLMFAMGVILVQTLGLIVVVAALDFLVLNRKSMKRGIVVMVVFLLLIIALILTTYMFGIDDKMAWYEKDKIGEEVENILNDKTDNRFESIDGRVDDLESNVDEKSDKKDTKKEIEDMNNKNSEIQKKIKALEVEIDKLKKDKER